MTKNASKTNGCSEASQPSEKNGKENVSINLLKVRDDPEPIQFFSLNPEAEKPTFQLSEGSEAHWLLEKEFGLKELRGRIEPWLTSLFQSEHLSLLLGSGLTHAVHMLAAETAAAGMDTLPLQTQYKDKINAMAEISAEKAGRQAGNLEDQIRVANELLRGLEILGQY